MLRGIEADGEWYWHTVFFQTLDLKEVRWEISFTEVMCHGRPIASMCPQYVLVRDLLPRASYILWGPGDAGKKRRGPGKGAGRGRGRGRAGRGGGRAAARGRAIGMMPAAVPIADEEEGSEAEAAVISGTLYCLASPLIRMLRACAPAHM